MMITYNEAYKQPEQDYKFIILKASATIPAYKIYKVNPIIDPSSPRRYITVVLDSQLIYIDKRYLFDTFDEAYKYLEEEL